MPLDATVFHSLGVVFFSLQELQCHLEKDTGIPVQHQELFSHDGCDVTSLSLSNMVRIQSCIQMTWVFETRQQYSVPEVVE